MATPHSGVCVCVEHLFAKVLLILIFAGGGWTHCLAPTKTQAMQS